MSHHQSSKRSTIKYSARIPSLSNFQGAGYEECQEWTDCSNEVDGDDLDNYDADQYRFDHEQAEKSGPGCPKPKPLREICAKYECPPMEKVDVSGCGFEARKVLSANWTVTSLDITSDMRSGRKDAFWRLFKYISGANDQGAKIAMTVPVITKWYMDDDYEVVGAEMAFYIPSAFQANPPAPTDDQVRVENWGDAITYDRAYGGNSKNPEIYKKEFKKLYAALAKEGITPYTKMSITAGYTRPGWGRQRREMMLVDNSSM